TLRLANVRQDREQLSRICKAFYKLEGINLSVRDVISTSASEDGDYLRAWIRSALSRDELSKTTRDLLNKKVRGLADSLNFKAFEGPAFDWIDDLKTPATEAMIGDELYNEERAVWNELANEIMHQYSSDNVTLHILLQELDLRSKTPKPPPDAIPCYTIHASKGMEFGHVYLVAMVED